MPTTQSAKITIEQAEEAYHTLELLDPGGTKKSLRGVLPKVVELVLGIDPKEQPEGFQVIKLFEVGAVSILGAHVRASHGETSYKIRNKLKTTFKH